MIISKHRKSQKNRFHSREFKTKVAQARSFKRLLGNGRSWFYRFFIQSKSGRFLGILILMILAYYLFLSPRFRIVEAEVSGNQQVSADQIQTALSKIGEDRTFLIPKNHFLLMTKGYTQKVLTSQIPIVKEVVKTHRVWPNRIQLEIVERNEGFILKTNEENYLVDEEGIVIKQSPEEKDLLVVENQVEENVAISEALNPKLAAFIISTQKQWPNKVNSPINLVKMPGKAAQEVQFVSAEGWSALFDINRPVLSQLSNLALILNKQIPAKDRSRLAYIDLRLEKWAYYCYKNSPCQAESQQHE